MLIQTRKGTTLAAKAELKTKQNKIKLQAFDSSYFRGKGHFENDGTQNYLVFHPIDRYFKRIIGVANVEYVCLSKSNGFSDEHIRSITTSNYIITSELSHFGTKIRGKFKGKCLKQYKITCTNVFPCKEQFLNYINNLLRYFQFLQSYSIFLKFFLLLLLFTA